MTLVLTGLWPGLAGALVLGALVGAMVGLPRDRASAAVAGLLCLALIALAGLTVMELVPDRAGLWVETAAAMLGIYLIGCLAGGTGKLVLDGADTVRD